MTPRQAGTPSLQHVETLGDLFSWRVEQSPQGAAYREFDNGATQWRTYSWQDIAVRVARWQRAIHTLRLDHGTRVAILMPNCIEAICIDQAVLALGLVPVPMHALDNPASIGYILNDCACALAIVATGAQWQAIAACASYPALRLVLLGSGAHSPAASGAAPPCRALQVWLAEAPDQAPAPCSVTRDDLAAIVYTSGTTGKPKGVMLSHHNVLVNLRAVLARVEAGPHDVFLSFLPLSHTFERTIGYYLPMAAGSCVAYARSVNLLADDMLAVRPTVLVSVPRIYERVYARLQEQLEASRPLKRSLFLLAQSVGWRRFCRRQGLPGGEAGSALLDALLWPLLDLLVARKVRARFGARLRAAVTGGAPMAQSVARCLLALGVPVVQGYGMTETAPVVSANAVEDNWPATVGRPLDGIEVRLGERDELEVRAASVMLGYWNRPADTAAAFTPDGWLRTGDRAALEDGRIRITGRLKEIMVTSTGEKIAPADLELAILSDALFDQAMVVGENRPFVGAIVVLNKTLWADLAVRLHLDPQAPESVNAPATRALLLRRLQTATQALPRYAAPRAVRVALEPWTVENSLITPTLKLKREGLHARYHAEIESIYASKPNVMPGSETVPPAVTK